MHNLFKNKGNVYYFSSCCTRLDMHTNTETSCFHITCVCIYVYIFVHLNMCTCIHGVCYKNYYHIKNIAENYNILDRYHNLYLIN